MRSFFIKLVDFSVFFQFFSSAKVIQTPLISSSHASILTWFVSPYFAKPDVMNNTRVNQLGSDITTVLQRAIYNPVNYGSGAVPGGAKELLLRSLAPNCTQLILQCAVGRQVSISPTFYARLFPTKVLRKTFLY
jgi:hypothetical protein